MISEEAKSITFIEWNIGHTADADKIADELYSYLSGTCVIALLEVTQAKYQEFSALLEPEYDILYSLDLREPGKYDSKARQLGILFIFSKDIRTDAYNICERTLLPERTLWADFEFNQKLYRIAAFHSVTGCEYKKAKSINFDSFTEWIDEYEPDIVMMDANEPEVDHYEIKKMKFFYNKGNGAETFFNVLDDAGYKDCLAEVYDKDKFIEGEPLAVSHVIKGCRKKKRYDFIFVNSVKFSVIDTEYLYVRAVEASADHAIVVANVDLN